MVEMVSPAPEFSRLVDTTRLPAGEAVIAILATPQECAGLAGRFALLALSRLEAEVRLRRLPGGFIRLAAVFSADVVQSCVVTLEPVASRIEESFTLLYGGEEAGNEVILDGTEEIVEPLIGGGIDIGEAVAQQLSLVLDPYPQTAGGATEMARIAEAPPVADAPASPFAALARLRGKQ